MKTRMPQLPKDLFARDIDEAIEHWRNTKYENLSEGQKALYNYVKERKESIYDHPVKFLVTYLIGVIASSIGILILKYWRII